MKKKILKNQNGQGMMEYMIISCLIGIFCLAAMRNYGTKLRERVNHMRTEIEKIKVN